MIAKTLEETLNGGYNGLYGEVVTCDVYGMKTLPFVPDVVIDIGANVGVFTRFCRTLFPHALIVAVEPHPENIENFVHFTPPQEVLLVRAALGKADSDKAVIYHPAGAVNGSGEVYLSAGLGFPPELVVQSGMEILEIKTITLQKMVSCFTLPDEKIVVKIDCEGGENVLWDDPEAMVALSRADYITIELHDYGINVQERDKVIQKTQEALDSLQKTHQCERNGVYFKALKRT